MLDPQPWFRAAVGDEPERRLSNNYGANDALVLAPRAEYEQDHDLYPQPSDLDTVDGCIRVSNRAAEKLGTDISAAYEEMDGLHRPMSSPMGRLLHDGITNLVQIKSMNRFLKRRHDEKIAALQAELDASDPQPWTCVGRLYLRSATNIWSENDYGIYDPRSGARLARAMTVALTQNAERSEQ